MRETSLPSPGIGGKGYHLRRIAANAISQLELVAPRYPNSVHPDAATLEAFFAACAAGVDAIDGVVPTLSFTPAMQASIAAGPQAGLVLNVGGSAGAVAYTSSVPAKATVHATTGVVTPVATGTTVITATIAADAANNFKASSITYTVTVVA